MYKCLNKKNKEFIALKRVDTIDEKICQDGFPITGIREIKILKNLSHTNIVQLKEIIVSKATEENKWKGTTFLVFEYVEHDLDGIFKEIFRK